MAYFKLAAWDARNFCFRDGKTAYATEADAVAAANADGQYRVSRVEESGRTDLTPFTVAGKGKAKPAAGGFKGLPTATSLVFGRRFPARVK